DCAERAEEERNTQRRPRDDLGQRGVRITDGVKELCSKNESCCLGVDEKVEPFNGGSNHGTGKHALVFSGHARGWWLWWVISCRSSHVLQTSGISATECRWVSVVVIKRLSARGRRGEISGFLSGGYQQGAWPCRRRWQLGLAQQLRRRCRCAA